MTNWDQFEALTFDCYGTLIDWETGILNGIKPVFSAHNVQLSVDEILATFAELETYTELSITPLCEPMLTYKEVLQKGYAVMDAAGVGLCMAEDLPIVVFNLTRHGDLVKAATRTPAASGKNVGTRVS